MAWETKRPALPAKIQEEDTPIKFDDGDIYKGMDAALALIHLPLDKEVGKENLRLRPDGGYSVEFLRGDFNGLLLHNAPAGRYLLEAGYGGEKQILEVDLPANSGGDDDFSHEPYGLL